MKKKLLYLLFTLCFFTLFRAQDIHFSQFNEQPALVNPALTGATASARASIVYRNQWRSIASPFVSMGASAETRFNSSEWQQVDKFRGMTFKERTSGRLAAGLSVYKDNAGDGSINFTQINFSLASFIPTGKKSFVSVGLQAGWAQYILNTEKLVFPNQYNGTGYDASMSSNEKLVNQANSYGDFAAGALWSFGQNDKSYLGKRQLKANIGAAIYHLSKGQSFLINGKSERSFKWVLHGDLLASLSNPDFAIAPSYLLQFRGSSQEIIAGMLLKRYIRVDSKYTGIVKRSSIGAGLYYRNRDAVILNIALDIKEQYTIGFSYDVNTSRLSKGTNARGGFELNMRYTPPHSFLFQRKEKTK